MSQKATMTPIGAIDEIDAIHSFPAGWEECQRHSECWIVDYDDDAAGIWRGVVWIEHSPVRAHAVYIAGAIDEAAIQRANSADEIVYYASREVFPADHFAGDYYAEAGRDALREANRVAHVMHDDEIRRRRRAAEVG